MPWVLACDSEHSLEPKLKRMRRRRMRRRRRRVTTVLGSRGLEGDDNSPRLEEEEKGDDSSRFSWAFLAAVLSGLANSSRTTKA